MNEKFTLKLGTLKTQATQHHENQISLLNGKEFAKALIYWAFPSLGHLGIQSMLRCHSTCLTLLKPKLSIAAMKSAWDGMREDTSTMIKIPLQTKSEPERLNTRAGRNCTTVGSPYVTTLWPRGQQFQGLDICVHIHKTDAVRGVLNRKMGERGEQLKGPATPGS